MAIIEILNNEQSVNNDEMTINRIDDNDMDSPPHINQLNTADFSTVHNQDVITYLAAFKKIAYAALPFSLARVIIISGGFINNIMLAKVNRPTLAASNLINTTQSFLMTTSTSLLFSTGILIGLAHGQGKNKLVGRIFYRSLILGGAIATPVFILSHNLESILIMAKQNPGLARIVQNYFKGFSYGIPAFILNVSQQQLSLGVSKPLLLVVSSFLYASITSFASYPLTFGKWGMPELYVAGVGYGSTIAAYATLSSISIYMVCRKDFNKYLSLKNISKNLSKGIIELLQIGIPISINIGTELFSLEMAGFMAGWLGKDKLTSQQISMQYSLLVLNPIYGIALSSSVVISQSLGSKRTQDIKRIGYLSLGAGLCITTLALISFISFPRYLASAFINIDDPANDEILRATKYLMLIDGLGLVADSMRHISASLLRGYGDHNVPTVVSISVMCVLAIPLGYILGFPLHLGIHGIAIARSSSMALGAAVLFHRWRQKDDKVNMRNVRVLPVSVLGRQQKIC